LQRPRALVGDPKGPRVLYAGYRIAPHAYIEATLQRQKATVE
jgi:hypothetical protein